MAIAIAVQSVNSSGDITQVAGTLTFSGSYATGGDTLDWTTANEQISETGQVLSVATPPKQMSTDSQNGNAGYYVPVQGSALNNWKVKCFVGSGTEVSAGAYPSSVTGDIVAFRAEFAKLQ